MEALPMLGEMQRLIGMCSIPGEVRQLFGAALDMLQASEMHIAPHAHEFTYLTVP